MPIAPADAPAPLAADATDVVDAKQLALLEASFRMPAVEPARPANASRRRAAAVVRAADSGVEPMELFAAMLFGVLAIGLVVLVALTLAG